MNWDQVEGNWEQAKGKIRQYWGKLTDDEIAEMKGKRQALAGKLQERYGYGKESVQKEIEKFLNDKNFSSCSGKSKSESSGSCDCS